MFNLVDSPGTLFCRIGKNAEIGINGAISQTLQNNLIVPRLSSLTLLLLEERDVFGLVDPYSAYALAA
jgi:hypothetical protein